MKKILFFIFSLLILMGNAQKQRHKLDSLLKSYNKETIDSFKVKTLIEVCVIYQNIKIDSALFYAKLALSTAEKVKYTSGIAASYNGIGYSYFIKGDMKLATQNLFSAYNIYKKHKVNKTGIYNILNIGAVYSQREKQDSAIYYISEAYRMSQQINAPKYMADCLINLGEATRNMGKYSESVDYFFRAIKEYEKINEQEGVNIANLGIGNLYFNQNKYLEAADYYLKALAYVEKNHSKGFSAVYNNLGGAYLMHSSNVKDSVEAKKYIDLGIDYMNKGLEENIKQGNKSSIARSYGNIGTIYADAKNYPKAKEYFLKGLELSKESNNKLSEIKNYERLGELYSLTDDSVNARINLLEALKIAQDIKSKDKMIGVNEKLYKHYYRIKKYDEAFKYQSNFMQYKDSLLNQQNQNKLSQLKTEYETEKKESQIALLAKDKMFRDLLIIDQNNQILNKQIEAKQKESEIDLLSKDKSLKEVLLQQEIIQKQKEQKENELLNTENKLSTETIRQQQIISYFIITGLLLTIGLAFFIFNGLKNQRKANRIISEQKKEVESQKHLVEEKQKEILDSIHYAKRIQTTLLAHADFVNENIPNNFILFKPKDIVSGDFYWATKRGHLFYLAICDSTGHGVPGAFMSLLNIGFLSEAINEKNILAPNDVFNYVRDRLVNSVSKDGQQDGFDGILLCIDQKNKELTYAAANNAPVIVSGGEIIHLEADKMPVGKGIKNTPFQLFNVKLKKEETLYLYTDGYADQFGGIRGKKFMYKKLNELLIANSGEAFQVQKNMLDQTFEEWKGNLEQVDDVLLVGIRV